MSPLAEDPKEVERSVLRSVDPRLLPSLFSVNFISRSLSSHSSSCFRTSTYLAESHDNLDSSSFIRAFEKKDSTSAIITCKITVLRVQIKSKTERLKRLVSTAKDHYCLSSLLLNITRSLMEIITPISDPASGFESSSFEVPNTEDVGNFLEESLPAASFIFKDELFNAPMLPMILLFGVAEVLGCGNAPSSYVQPLEVTEEEKKDSRLMIHVWLSYILDLSKEYFHFVIHKFEAARGPTIPRVQSSPMDIPQSPTQFDFPSTPMAHPSLPNPHAYEQTHATRPPTLDDCNDATKTTPNTRTEGHEVSIAGLPNNYDDSRKANDVQMMFKDSMFTADLSRDI